MSGILCKQGGRTHRHPTADAVRACHGQRRAVPAPVTAQGYTPQRRSAYVQVVHQDAPPTSEQLRYITRLGGDVRATRGMNRQQVSDYIDRIKSQKARTRIMPMPSETPVRQRQQTAIPLNMLSELRDGRYAWRPDSESRWTYVRVSRPKTGRYKGATKIQTQHGENLKERMVVWPSGQVTLHQMNQWIEPVLLGIMVAQDQAAIDYGRKMQRCCRCGIELTLGRSQHYGLGSECEKHWPHVIELVDVTIGPWLGEAHTPSAD